LTERERGLADEGHLDRHKQNDQRDWKEQCELDHGLRA